MGIDARHASALVLAVAGCAGTPAPPPRTERPPARAAGDARSSAVRAPIPAPPSASANPTPWNGGVEAAIPEDYWPRFNGRRLKGVIGESIDVVNPDVKALSAPCRSLYERFAKKVPGSFLFVCARAPSGETWSSVASLALPPNEETQIVIGTWQLIVQSGAKVVKAAPAHFQLFASHSGGACQLDPEVCLDYGHYAGLLEPIGFVFVDVDGKPHSEAFVVGSEELENSQAQEVAITLWDLKGNALEMDELTRNAQVAGVADCDGDGLPEFALNPYRSQANAFLFRYGPHYRGTSELWTELLTLGKGGGWSKDDALARRYAARLCPTEETAPFGRPPGNWPGAIHCAKLWGHGSELAAALERACNAPRDDDTRMFCTDNRAALEHMVETDVPRLLPAPPAEPLPRGCFDQAMADGE